MKIHEYQAKELLAAPAPPFRAASSPPRRPRRSRRSTSWAAVRSCSRPRSTPAAAARARFKDSGKDFGGVKFVTNRDDAGSVAEVMFKYPLVTKQTGEAGPEGLARCWSSRQRPNIAREVYVGMVLDRAIGMPVLMACAEGGVEIEEVAARTPGEDPQDRRRPGGRPAAVPGSPRWPSTSASPATRRRRPRRS